MAGSSTRTRTERPCWRRLLPPDRAASTPARAASTSDSRSISLSARILAHCSVRRRAPRRARQPRRRRRGQHHQAANISASIRRLKAAIKELQEQGYDLPDYPEHAQSATRPSSPVYDSSRAPVNPVLARATPTAARLSVKSFSRRPTRPPRRLVRPDSQTHTAPMGGDFFAASVRSTRPPTP